METKLWLTVRLKAEVSNSHLFLCYKSSSGGPKKRWTNFGQFQSAA
jgi:hypothetical protein